MVKVSFYQVRPEFFFIFFHFLIISHEFYLNFQRFYAAEALKFMLLLGFPGFSE